MELAREKVIFLNADAQARFIEFQAEKLLRLYFLGQGEPFGENEMIDRII